MPLKLDNPKEEIRIPEKKVKYDDINIISLFIHDRDGYALVQYEVLFDGVFVETREHIIDGAKFASIALSAPNGVSRRVDLKNAVYNQMKVDLGVQGNIT